MKRLRQLIALCCALGAGQALGGEQFHELDHHGERSFRVYQPTDLGEPGKRPLLLVFHGGGGSVEGMVEMTGLDRTADEQGFIAVYPAGTGPLKDRLLTWNAGGCCGSAAREGVDDVGFVAKLIDFMIDSYGVDPARVVATGHSNGAMLSYRLACELADRIAAIAPNAAQGVTRDCSPSRPVPVLHIHGTEDHCASWAGGSCGGCFQRFLGRPSERGTWACDPVEDWVKKWAGFNHCADQTRVTLSKGAVSCASWLECRDGADVTLCRIDGGGHTWPGRAEATRFCRNRPEGRLCTRWKAIVGEVNRDVSANQLMWEFFDAHPLPLRREAPEP